MPLPSGPLHAAALIGALLVALVVGGCDEAQEAAPDPLLIYCGITMVHPIQDIAAIFEAETGVPVTISQGGSADLYRSLEASRIGDLYFPGSRSYRTENLDAGLLGEAVRVGYNVAALLVAEGNPKNVPPSVTALTDPALAVIIANPDSGSIGRETHRILNQVGLYADVLENAVYLATDSRSLNQALLGGTADVVLNWRATARFPENRSHIAVVDIDPDLAVPKELLLNLLTFSDRPDLARRFMKMASSERGQAIFRAAGFLDASGRRE